MQAGSVYRIRTVAANQFTGGLVQNAAALATLDFFEQAGATPGPSTFIADKMGIASGKHMRFRVREIRIISKQQLDWEVWLLGTGTIGGAVIGAEKMLGQWQFAAASGVNATGDTFFYYYVGGLDLAYENLDVDANGALAQTGKMYIRLINRNAVAKLANAAGAIEIEFAVELLQGR